MVKFISAIALFIAAVASPAHSENWPGFRGPTRQGVSSETGLPLKWSATENIAWKTAIPGEAWSSPIVWGDRVFVTTATDSGQDCRILCLDRKTGQIVWDKSVLKQVPRRKNDRNTYATPTPCTDDQRVYAVFGDGSFVAVDFEGNIAWTNRDYPFFSEHGLGTSPRLWEDLLIMARDGSSEGPEPKLGWQVPWDRSYLVAIDTKTGQQRWKSGRGLSRIGHVCPNIWVAPDGQAQVISGAGDVVQSHDARTGQLVWSAKNIGEGVVPSIVIGDGLAFTACGFSGRDSIKAFRLGDFKGELAETSLAWEQRKGMPRVPSFLYLRPHLFVIDDGGFAMCLKAESGEILKRQRIGGNYSASPVAADGRIYCLADDGNTVVLEASPELRVLAQNPLEEKTQASMAISGGQFFIRTATQLYCIGK